MDAYVGRVSISDINLHCVVEDRCNFDNLFNSITIRLKGYLLKMFFSFSGNSYLIKLLGMKFYMSLGGHELDH